MKKQELIHLHGVLDEVAEFCGDDPAVTPDLEEYESLGARPTSIHLSKGDHRDAVFALTEALAAEFGGAEADTVSASAD